MADDSGSVHSLTVGGIAGLHPEAPLPPAIVAATESGTEHNTLMRAVVPFACWRAHDMRFKFDSSFVLPTIKAEIRALKDLIDENTLPDESGQPTYKPTLSVFGHADPTGSDDYNKVLSGKRAQSIYALLVRDVDLWDDLYQNPLGNDRWHPEVIEAMQNELQRPLAKDLAAGERKTLYKDYMDSVCTVTSADGNPVNFQLEKTDFLAGGKDPKGKGDYQGCSEFNPVRIFSDQQNQDFSDPDQKDARDEENAINRRVLILLFRPGVQVEPDAWPCPRAKEGGAGCKKRFWSDGEDRRSTRLPDQERKYQETRDTFACRFYDRLLTKSPCEDERQPTKLQWIGWVPQGVASDSSLVLTNLEGEEFQKVSGETYAVDGFAGLCQRFQIDAAAHPTKFHLAVRTADYLLAPGIKFDLAAVARALMDSQQLQQAFKIGDAPEDEKQTPA